MRTAMIILAATLTLASCNSDKSNKNPEKPGVRVILKSPSAAEDGSILTVSGSVEAEHYANLSTRTMGYVSKVYVKVGDKVSKGQRLLDINSEEIDAKKAQARAGLRQAEAQLSLSEKNYNRYQKLFNENSASQKELDDMTLQYEMARANYERATQVEEEINAMMAYSHLRAPFSGVITSKTVKEGDMARPGHLLLSLETPGVFAVRAMIPESSIEHIEKGMEVSVFVKSISQSLKGTVSELSTSSQNSGGQYMIKINLHEADAVKLFSGMYVSVHIPVPGMNSSSLFIDQAALIKRGELDGIYTVSESGTAILRWLKLGQQMGDQVEVLSGLKPNEAYIASSDGKLYNGVKIAQQE